MGYYDATEWRQNRARCHLNTPILRSEPFLSIVRQIRCSRRRKIEKPTIAIAALENRTFFFRPSIGTTALQSWKISSLYDFEGHLATVSHFHWRWLMSEKRRFCARCKSEIPLERVEALPITRLCIECSQEIGSDFKPSYTQENLAKTKSLKKNHGGVKVFLTRRRIEPLKTTVAEANGWE